MVYDYLLTNYKLDEPIFLTDVKIRGMTEENLRYHLKKLTDDGIIARFAAGIYYLPQKNLLGESSALSAETVAFHKYICRKGKRVGFYSGYTLANQLGLSTQVPFKQEITSNFAPAAIREITIKNQTYIIKKPVADITDENAYVLQFLDCLKNLDQSAEESPAVCGKILTQFAAKHHITKSLVDHYLTYYPLKIYKALYDTEVRYVSA